MIGWLGCSGISAWGACSLKGWPACSAVRGGSTYSTHTRGILEGDCDCCWRLRALPQAEVGSDAGIRKPVAIPDLELFILARAMQASSVEGEDGDEDHE